MPEENKVSRILDQRGIPHRLFRHQKPISSVEEAAVERNQKPDQVIRSILFRLSQGSFVLVLIGGLRQISWPALRHYLGRSRLTLASPEEVYTVSGYKIGTVSPIGLPSTVRILADRSVFMQEEISFGAGEANAAIIMRSADLANCLDSIEVGDFALNTEF